MPYRESKTTDVKQALKATHYLGRSRTTEVTALTLDILNPPPHFLTPCDIQEQFRCAE